MEKNQEGKKPYDGRRKIGRRGFCTLGSAYSSPLGYRLAIAIHQSNPPAGFVRLYTALISHKLIPQQLIDFFFCSLGYIYIPTGRRQAKKTPIARYRYRIF